MRELAQAQVGDVGQVGRRPEAAGGALGRCMRPFMASTKALLRLSSMPRTTASKWVLSVVAKALKDSSRLRRAHEIHAVRSAAASAAWLCVRALANTSRNAIVNRHARALLRLARCSRCIAMTCVALHPDGLRRIPHKIERRSFGLSSPSSSNTRADSPFHSARRTASIASLVGPAKPLQAA